MRLRRVLRKSWASGPLLLALVLAVSLALVPSAASAFNDVKGAGVFELDGNIAHDSPTTPPFDWANLFSSSGTPLNPGPPLITSILVPDYAVPDPSTFTGGGSKDINDVSQWACATQNNPQSQSDILNAYAAVIRPSSGPAAQHTLLYLGSERRSTQGDFAMGFWLLQNPASCTSPGSFTGSHANGDILVIADFVNGGATSIVNVYQWQAGAPVLMFGGSGANCPTVTRATEPACGAVNTTSIVPPWPNGGVTLAPNAFLEVGVDLTDIFPGPRVCSSTFVASTRSSGSSIDSELKDYALGTFDVCTHPSVATLLSTASVTVGGGVFDSATLSGASFDARGTVTYNAYLGAACSGTPAFSSTVPVTNGTVPNSSTFSPTAPGTYQWQAVYSGDLGLSPPGLNRPAISPCSSEPLTVNKATPGIVTTPHPSIGPAGATISDTATVSGGFNPTGTVTFSLFGPGDLTCAGPPVATFANVPLSGGSATSAAFTTTQAGTYRWIATYNGDANNNTISSPCQSEPVAITKVTPAISTAPSPSQAALGSPVHDSATVTGGLNPTGSVTFQLFGPNDPTCSGTAVFTSTVALTAGSASSAAFTPTAVGPYEWVATYGGDGANNGASSPCGAEPLTVEAVVPELTTAPLPASRSLGGTLSDTATVSSPAGVPVATGTVDFRLFGPNNLTCAGAPVFVSLGVVLVNGTATSAQFTPVLAGTYEWIATYSGDANHTPTSTSCGAEPAQVAKDLPAISTTPTPASAPVGTPVTDVATVSGGFSPTGTVTFRLFGPADTSCAGPAAFTSTVALTSGQATSAAFALATVGTYRWVAAYSGDANNTAVTTGCQDELVTAGQASPTISTTPSPGGSVPASISDTATVSGGFSPSGMVTFQLFGPTDPTCSSDPVFTSTGTLSSGTATSGSFTAGQAGTYHWIATYGGDANNNPVSSGCNDEVVVIDKAKPLVSTTPSPPVTVGGSISDSAFVSEGFNPTGVVFFEVFGPNAPTAPTCTQETLADTFAAPLLGGMATSPPFTPSEAGTYNWVAIYLGDSNNLPAATTCDAESVAVAKATPTISTNPIPRGGPVGTVIHDTVSVGGGFSPTGTVTFGVFAPGDATCSGTNLVAGQAGFSDVPLQGVTATSAGFSTAQVGQYHWTATYNGDVNNQAVSSACLDEPVNINQAAPALVTTPSSGGPVGTVIHDSAVVNGGFNPSGTVTFALYGPGDTGCTTNLVAGDPSFQNVPISGGGAQSPDFTSTQAGTYQWVAHYNGDANNQPASGACGDPSEQVAVTEQSGGVSPAETGTLGGALLLAGLPLLLIGGLVLLYNRRRRKA